MSYLEYQDGIHYSARYADDEFEYRHVILPKQMMRCIPRDYFQSEDGNLLRKLADWEWRKIGITQSLGWENYETFEPEPHILLFRREKDYGIKYPTGKPAELESFNQRSQAAV